MRRGLQHLLGRVNWGYATAIFISLMTWAVACASAQQSLSYAQLSDDLGVTFCFNGESYSFVRVGMTDVQTASTTAHELKHQEQIARTGNECEKFAAYYGTPVGQLESEAEAYAADLCVAVSMGADKRTLGADYAARIAHYLGGEANSLAAVQSMAKYDTCKDTADRIEDYRSIMPGWTSQ